MNSASFWAEIKRYAPTGISVPDPLKRAQLFIDRHGATGENIFELVRVFGPGVSGAVETLREVGWVQRS